MPREARLDAPGTLHHVMIRGLEGEAIFYDDANRENFLFRRGQLAERTGDRILAWSLMNNMLIYYSSAGLMADMREI